MTRRPAPAARSSKVDWLALLAGDPSVLVKEAFKAVALLAGQKIAGLAAEKACNAALGWILRRSATATCSRTRTWPRSSRR